MKLNSAILFLGIALLLALIVIFNLAHRSNSPETSNHTMTLEANNEGNISDQPDEDITINKHKAAAAGTVDKSPAQRSAQRSNNPASVKTTSKTETERAAEKHLRNSLTRNDSLITREKLADGTELIHLNGSYAHVSTAAITQDGTIHTECHHSYEALEQHGQQQEHKTIPTTK